MNNLLQLVHQNAVCILSKICPSQNLEMVDRYGNTPLLLACYLGRTECVKILIDVGANLRALNYFGQNALTLATYNGHTNIVKYLLRYRSYMDFTLSSMIPPLCVAIMRNHRDLTDLFMRSTPNVNEIKTVHGVSVTEMMQIFDPQNYKTPSNLRM